MSTCKLPKKLCLDMDGVVRKFWWSPKKSGNKYYSLVAWKELCQLLSVEGFCITILKAKYHVGSNWLNSPPTRAASFVWRGIEGPKSLLARGACKVVGSGDSILIWSEPWVPGLINFKPLPKDSLEEISCLAVSQLMNQAKSD